MNMKTLIVLVIILAILTVYFVLNIEKSFSIKGLTNESGSKIGNAVPAGIDIAKFILNKIKGITPEIADDLVDNVKNQKLGGISESNVVDKIKSTIGDVKDKILEGSVNLIKEPIKNKVNDLFCSQD